jgi:hypothetical protein
MQDGEQGDGAFALARQKIVHHLTDGEDVDMQAETGMFFQQVGGCLGNQNPSDARRRTKAERAAIGLRHAQGPRERPFQLFECQGDLALQAMGFGCRHQPAAMPVEQSERADILDAPDRLGDCRLRDAQFSGRADDGAAAHQCPEDFDLAQREQQGADSRPTVSVVERP